jgi:prephenate dehydrogenase
MIHITIIGMGLIGTSLGMALRDADERPAALAPVHITGYDQDPRSTSTARGRLAIDHEAKSLEQAVAQAQVVVVATPVQVIRTIFAQLAPLLPEGTIVTDTASTKALVCDWARELLPEGVAFVGGHPMAGREQAGPQAADANLFAGAIYCLTPAADTAPHAIDTVEALVSTAGARPYYLDPHEHDAYVAGISHLPFLLSAALVEITSRSPAWKEMATLAASGFRDVSRLASGDVVMHRDICMTNRAALLRWVNEMMAFLLEVREHLEQEDAEALTHLFEHAKVARDAWLERTPGLRPGEEVFESTPQVERPNLFGFRRRRQ